MNKHGDPIFLLHFFDVHIMNVNHAKFQISRELPYTLTACVELCVWASAKKDQRSVVKDYSFSENCFRCRKLCGVLLLLVASGYS